MKKTLSKERSRTKFYVLLTVLLGLVFVRYALQVSFPRVVLLIVVVLIACSGDRDEVAAIIVCCIPLHESLDLFYTLSLCACIFVLKYWRTIRINGAVIPLLLMFFWELLHGFENGLSIPKLIVSFIPMLVLLVLMSSAERGYDYELIVRAYVYALIVACVCLLIKLLYLSEFNFIVMASQLRRLGVLTAEETSQLVVSGGDINANSIGVLCVLATTGLMQLRIAGYRKKKDVAQIVVLLTFGALTASRTYLVCLIAMIMLFLFGQRGSLKKKATLFMRIVLVVLVVLLLMWLIFPDVLTYYISRFDTDDITTGRDRLMVDYHKFILSKPKYTFFGVGVLDFGEKVMETLRISTHVPHNGIQEILVAWGIPGLLLFIALLVMMVYYAGRYNSKRGLINYIPLIIIMLKAQAGQLLMSAYTMLSLSFAYLSLCCDLSPKQVHSVRINHENMSAERLEKEECADE